MRTNIDLDDTLMSQAMAVTGLATKKATVEHALRFLVRNTLQRKAISDMNGLGWDGDLETMRLDKSA
ncbi:transcriptional regulator [Pararhizobium polonicum]|uniref:Transcriptional regulator n=1 Tax=Pararhizobium polonicum TaxID=1612624 RepID=A0A1C7P4B3_9HYPH|nr:type II toxin-antitoxin system VapB family antitoxin [Pararhizobium polonicum]OBZ96037.1 transcriptional regulator [Pararhizobium polonicum]